MRRPSKFFPNKLSVDSQRLISLAQETAKATSRIEKRAWEQTMDGIVQKLLKAKRQDAIEAARKAAEEEAERIKKEKKEKSIFHRGFRFLKKFVEDSISEEE